MNGLEERVGKIEGTLKQIDKGLDSMDKRFESIDTRLNHFGDELHNLNATLNNKIDSVFKWIVGILLGVLIPMWVSIILTILFKK